MTNDAVGVLLRTALVNLEKIGARIGSEDWGLADQQDADDMARATKAIEDAMRESYAQVAALVAAEAAAYENGEILTRDAVAEERELIARHADEVARGWNIHAGSRAYPHSEVGNGAAKAARQLAEWVRSREQLPCLHCALGRVRSLDGCHMVRNAWEPCRRRS